MDLALKLMRPDIRAGTTFRRRHNDGDWEQLLKSEEENDVSDRRDIIRYLNHYELMAVAIRGKVVDENILKAIIGDRLAKYYTQATEFISFIRTKEGDPEFFEHLEYMSERWRNNPTVSRKGMLR